MPSSRTSSQFVKLYNLRTKFDFGKYHGARLDVVLDYDPKYVKWVLNNVRTVIICDQAMKILKENIVAEVTRSILSTSKLDKYTELYTTRAKFVVSASSTYTWGN